MVRTRFAPSPTGFLHVGGLRTALYNYLFARKNNGRFLLRIEDTDQRRKVVGAVENLLETLAWAGVKPDEGPRVGGDFGPYVQSERLELYRRYARQLVDGNQAYYCFCSADRLKQLKEWQIAHKIPPRYDNHCRNFSADEVQRRLKTGAEHVIRMKIPSDGMVKVNDLIRGQVIFPVNQIDDQVLLKSDDYPTYHLANVVDDHLMQISHVIRGEEWLPSTPKHVLLYRYFGWELPQFAHLSLLLNPDKSKLSKRQGDVAVEDYRSGGYLPEALINFLALLGWNPGNDREIFSMDELVREFSLERVSKSGAIFNVEKLNWMNGVYIRKLSQDDFKAKLRSNFPAIFTNIDDYRMASISASVQSTGDTFAAILENVENILIDPASYTAPEIQEYLTKPESLKILETLIKITSDLKYFDPDEFSAAIKAVQIETGIKGKPLWMTIRAALTGKSKGMEIHEIVKNIDKQTCLRRLQSALEYATRKIS